MRNLRPLLLTVYVAASLLATPASFAKRVAPKAVLPLVFGGIRYSADGDGRDQYVVAITARTRKPLWKVKVFHNSIDANLEEDIQWIFITKLKLSSNSLLVKDERKRCYTVDLTTKRVQNIPCTF